MAEKDLGLTSLSFGETKTPPQKVERMQEFEKYDIFDCCVFDSCIADSFLVLRSSKVWSVFESNGQPKRIELD